MTARGRAGFTLVEVVVSLLVLEVAVVGVVGALALASTTMTRAEVIERGVATAEGVIDSLAGVEAAAAGSVAYAGGVVSWAVEDSSRITLTAIGPAGDTIVMLRSVVGPP